MDSISDGSSKRLQTSLGGFSEITAFSQRGINCAMDKLLKQYPEICHVTCKTKRNDSIDAMISQALVSLEVTGASREDLYYCCQFSSGTLYFDYDPPKQLDMTGWTIAFSVEIGLEDVVAGTEEDQQVRSVINQPGDFSIRSLFLIFNQADIIKLDETQCDFKGALLDDFDLITLAGILAFWYVDSGVMNDRRKRTIGYGLYTANPDSVNEQAPTFPPTSLKFQTYEYIAPGESKPQEGIGKGDNNMLLYLQMTGNKDFPDGAILPYSGNFVSDGMDGTMCVSQEIFWQDYLLRKSTPRLLQSINPVTYAWVKSTDQSNSFLPQFNIALGDSGHEDDFFLWNPEAVMDWTWEPEDSEQHFNNHQKEENGSSNLKITCSTANTMTAKSGSNKIQISGTTSILIEASGTGGVIIAPWDYSYKIHVWFEWSTMVTLSAVEDGGIQISLGLPSDPTDAFTVQSEILQNYFNVPYGDTDHITEHQKNMVVTSLTQQLKSSSLGDIEAELQKNLNSAARFVVPGGGSLSYKNPMFNDNGDLLVEVSYKVE